MDKAYLLDRLRELGIYSTYYHRMELKPLASVLPYDEKLNCIFTGYYDGQRRMVAVTDSRIIIIATGALSATGLIIIKRTAVTEWKFEKKFLLSSASITAEGKTYVFAQTQAGIEKLFNWAMQQPVKEIEE
ncbi:MAG: PH domain-containing protein [Sphaerochaetaceae bacterium]|nr:PH domain-containing protein [Sphaerochaetaceae bacterium]